MTSETAARRRVFPDHARLIRLKRFLTWLAATVAVAVAVAIPVIYLLTAYRYETLRVERTAQDLAETVSGFVYSHPDLWQFSTNRLEKILLSRAGDEQLSQLLGPNGDIIAATQPVPDGGAVQTSYRFSIEGVAEVFNGDVVIGTIRVTESPSPVLVATGWIAVLGSVLAAAVFAILRMLPLRALDTAMSRLNEVHAAMRVRLDELEATKEHLERKTAELARFAKQLARMRDAAEAANRAKSEFLAAMSHELRTPLNAIIGFSEIIKDETFGPVGSVQYRDYSQDIHESGQHLLGLINDILDLSKVESGEDELRENDIDIRRVVRSVLTLVTERARKGGVALDLDWSDDLPALRADERKLKQILVNLLANAIKFTDAGGKVILKVRCRADDGFAFQIIDNGIGIAPEDIPKALSRFGQIDGDLDRQYEGTGLGLPLTKALVELHGGTLDLQSQVGSGTTVTVRFPPERIVHEKSDARTGTV